MRRVWSPRFEGIGMLQRLVEATGDLSGSPATADPDLELPRRPSRGATRRLTSSAAPSQRDVEKNSR